MKNASVSHATSTASAPKWDDEDEEDDYAAYLRAVYRQAVSHPDNRPRSEAELKALRTPKAERH